MNPRHMSCIKTAADGLTTEISHRQYEEETADKMYSGSALLRPERWEHARYKLTMTMLDLFTPSDDVNIVATVLCRRLVESLHPLQRHHMRQGVYLKQTRARHTILHYG